MPSYQIVRPFNENYYIELDYSFAVVWKELLESKGDFLEISDINGNTEYIGADLLKNSIIKEVIQDEEFEGLDESEEETPPLSKEMIDELEKKAI